MIRLLVFLSGFVCCASGIEFHVAPGGSDGADGTAAHPFASLSRARDEVRKAKPAGGAVIVLHDGFLPLTEPLVPEVPGIGLPSVVHALDVLQGLLIAMAASLLLVIYRSSKATVTVLGELPGKPGSFAASQYVAPLARSRCVLPDPVSPQSNNDVS